MNLYIKETLKYILRSSVMIAYFVRHISKLYTLPESKLFEYNEKKFLKIFKKAIKKSRFYKKLYSDHNIDIDDIKSIKDIEKLPIIDRKIVKENGAMMLTVPRCFVWSGHTSGTTGFPLTVYADYFSILKEQAYQYVLRKNRGFKYGDRLVSLRGHLGHDLLKMRVHISNTLYLSSFQINEDTIHTYLNKIRNFNPIAIEGYPSFLYNLCFLLRKIDRKIFIPRCFTSSETLFDFQRELIKEYLNTEIYDYYGNTERTISLVECMDHRGYFSQPGYSINEFRNDCIVTTSLINASFPLIRYKVDDVVSITKNLSFSDSELCIVDSIEGRTGDTIIAKDGSFFSRSNYLFKNMDRIKIAQIIQHTKGEMRINIVPDGEFSESDRKKLTDNVHHWVGIDNMDFTICLVDDSEIIYTKRNKFRQIVSMTS
jgi:phenylacetate-CoA ligase